jgi:3-phenylpropionate/cinnamic acid dioxygenase small subunit
VPVNDKDTMQRLADELQIRNVIARLAQLADGGDLDEYVGLFTDDASWEMPGAPRRGRADILAGASERRASGQTGPGSATRHLLTTICVQVGDGDTSVADSYWLFYADTTTTPVVRLMGHYHDTFARSTDGWQLARREITFG